MDGSGINPIDRFKYRAIKWVREKLYEVPAGFLLAEGALPPSIQAMNQLFKDRPLSVFLPYEVFTEEGLFKTVVGNDGAHLRAIFSFSLTLTTPRRLGRVESEALQRLVERELPEGYFLQVIAARLPGDLQNYTAMLCLSSPEGEDRSRVLAVREAYEHALDRLEIANKRVDADGLLHFIAQAFDRADAAGYDDTELLKNQCGCSGLNIQGERIELVDSEDKPFRDIHLFNGRRFGFKAFLPLADIYPAILNGMNYLAVTSLQREGEGVVGQFVFAELTAPGATSQAAAVFSSRGWLIERDGFNTHLTFLTLIPMGINAGMAELLLQKKRWRSFTLEQLYQILPLPYQANVQPAQHAARVVPMGGANHA